MSIKRAANAIKPTLEENETLFLHPQWMTDALRYAELLHENQSVIEVQHQRLSGGFMANTYLLTIRYSNNTVKAPSLIVAKFPSSNKDSRQAGKEMAAYEREVRFYQEISPRLSMRIPKFYYGDFDPETANFTLLMEYLGDTQVLTGKTASPEQVKRCARQLAALHADTWNDESLFDKQWIPNYRDADYISKLEQWSCKGWEIMKVIDGVYKPDCFLDVGEKVLKSYQSMKISVDDRFCMIHCDYRMANILHRHEKESIAVDWQTLHIGNPGFDTFYYINSSYGSKISADQKFEVLREYHNSLIDKGVSNYSWDDCVEDYNTGAFYAALMVMSTVYGVGGTTELSDYAKKEFFSVVPRYWNYINDNKLVEQYLN